MSTGLEVELRVYGGGGVDIGQFIDLLDVCPSYGWHISLTQTGLSCPLQDVYQIVTCRNNGLTKVEHHSGKDNQSKVDTKS